MSVRSWLVQRWSIFIIFRNISNQKLLPGLPEFGQKRQREGDHSIVFNALSLKPPHYITIGSLNLL
jgi:hypothetical protein